MQNRQNDLYNVGIRVKKFIVAHSDLLAVIDDFNVEVAELDTILEQLEAAFQKQAANLKGITQEKKDARNNMAETLMRYCERAKVKAKRADLNDLVRAVSKPKRHYMLGYGSGAIIKANNMLELLQKHADVFTNIKEADWLIIEQSIAHFNQLERAPFLKRVDKKLSGTKQIDVLLTQLDGVVENIGGLVYSYLHDTDAALLFKAIRRIGYKPDRHTIVHLLPIDAATEQPILGALAINLKTNKTVQAKGTEATIIFPKVNHGRREFELQHPLYQTLQATHHIKRGRLNEITVRMERKVT